MKIARRQQDEPDGVAGEVLLQLALPVGGAGLETASVVEAEGPAVPEGSYFAVVPAFPEELCDFSL
jgi:hypothetical protein